MEEASVLVRPRPALFRALGKADPPDRIEIDGCRYRRIDVLKHDSWAATAIYEPESAAAPKVVCKFNRQQSILGFPMRWLGRRLAQRERAMLERLASTGFVPIACGRVSADGKTLDFAVAHDYIEGQPLTLSAQLNDDFFPDLKSLLGKMHSQGMAYVDLNKRENVLVGDDGRPYLIDFQISVSLHDSPWMRWRPIRWLLGIFQQADDYHLLKHWIRHRPDQCGLSPADLDRLRPWWIRMHRKIGVPLRTLRRRLLALLGIRNATGRAESEQFAEHAIRCEAANRARSHAG